MKKKISVFLAVFTSLLIVIVLPLNSFAAYNITTDFISPGSLSYNTNAHVETWNKAGSKVYDLNSPVSFNIETQPYANGVQSLSLGVYHQDMFRYLYDHGFDTFQFGRVPNESQYMYSGLIGHGFRFPQDVKDRFAKYFESDFGFQAVTISFQIAFYIESQDTNINVDPEYYFSFWSNGPHSFLKNMKVEDYSSFTNSYYGVGFLGTYSLNFNITDFQEMLNSFIGVSFRWDGFEVDQGEVTAGYNNNFVYAFNLINCSIESDRVSLDGINQNINAGNQLQNQTNGWLENIFDSFNQNGNSSFNPNFGDVDYNKADQLDDFYDSSFNNFTDDFNSFFSDSFLNNIDIINGFSLYGQMLTIGFSNLPFLESIFSFLILFIVLNLLNGIVGLSKSSRSSNYSNGVIYKSDFD